MAPVRLCTQSDSCTCWVVSSDREFVRRTRRLMTLTRGQGATTVQTPAELSDVTERCLALLDSVNDSEKAFVLLSRAQHARPLVGPGSDRGTG